MVNTMAEETDNTTRIMIMRSFLAQSGARSPAVALMMLQRAYPDATETERKQAITSSLQAANRPR
jgi:hypothetical protein